ncbi:DUF2264 domain-containing protein [Nonomuraea glycinis]|uniref:DUF2264 domain-containing protein n=1 Tax=Nonomuraea glycinis TaxID=2047744 RepID=UPI002E14DE40|nr:DUF2264 domain-containing protein [Nonomuraea glycinis]
MRTLREFDDRLLSPYTGWTRNHWAALADHLLLSARRYASDTHARISFPGPAGGYGSDVDGLEGFARTFLAAGFRVAGESGRDPHGLMDWYAQGLAAGTDPHSPERWVRLDEHGQPKVEAASLALVLHLTRPWLWDRLDPRVQEQVVDYLTPAIGSDYPPINWIWFQIVVEQFLLSVGGPARPGDVQEGARGEGRAGPSAGLRADMRRDIDAGLAFTDGFARENGWYADGAERAYDHYSGWALQFYPVIWTEMAAGDPAADSRRAVYLERLERYLRDAVHLVGADGSPLIQGRSLTYRFAAATPFWTGAYAGLTTPAPGLLRRAASGIVRHFAEHGAPDDDGVLTLGWHHPWRPIAQTYSGPGSPYWAAKGMFGLALPADHPVWTAVEEPLPAETGDFRLALPAPGWLVSGTRADGIVRVLNHGTDHSHPGTNLTDSPLYARLGYSTATSPVLAGEHAAEPLDQSAAILDEHGLPSHRTGFDTLLVDRLPTGTLLGASRWQAHWVTPDPTTLDHGSGRSGEVRLGPHLTVLSAVRGPWELRLIRLTPAGPITGPLRIGGWPLPAQAPSTDDLSLSAQPPYSSGASNGALHSLVIPGPGLDLSEVTAAEDSAPLAPWTLIPWCATSTPAQPEKWYEAAIYLGGQLPEQPPTITWNGPTAHLTWPDDTTDTVDTSPFS